MQVYSVAEGTGNSVEASKDYLFISTERLKENFDKLQEKHPDGTFYSVVKGKYTPITITADYLEESLKYDTVHVVFGIKKKPLYWYNINTVTVIE